MLKFFGISKKTKISIDKTANIFVSAIDDVISSGFLEIIDFINNNNNLETNPNITDKDIKWFRLIVFVGNLKMLSDFFDEDYAQELHNKLIDFMVKKIEGESDVALEQLIDYESYISEILKKCDDCTEAMARAIFETYKINKFQVSLFKRKNEPNPVFFQELKNLMSHFIWNWDEFLSKYKIIIRQYN